MYIVEAYVWPVGVGRDSNSNKDGARLKNMLARGCAALPPPASRPAASAASMLMCGVSESVS